MEAIEPALLWVAGICAAILSIYGVVAKLREPYKAIDKRLSSLERKVEDNEKHLAADLKSFRKLEKVLSMQTESNVLILEHLATGNHNQDMQAMADKMKRFLYGESTKLK